MAATIDHHVEYVSMTLCLLLSKADLGWLTFRAWNASCLVFTNTPAEYMTLVGSHWLALLLSTER